MFLRAFSSYFFFRSVRLISSFTELEQSPLVAQRHENMWISKSEFPEVSATKNSTDDHRVSMQSDVPSVKKTNLTFTSAQLKKKAQKLRENERGVSLRTPPKVHHRKLAVLSNIKDPNIVIQNSNNSKK